MDRRSFIAGVLSAVPLASAPNFAGAASSVIPDETQLLKERIVSLFPLLEIKEGTQNVMSSHMLAKKTEDGEYGFRVEKVVTDVTQKYDLDELFPDDIFFTDFSYFDNMKNIPCMTSGRNHIAIATRRARGNHYAVFPNHILIWYKGKSDYDSPFTRVGKNIAKHPNYKNYFVKVRGVKLSDEDHEILASQNFTRVV